MVGAGGIDTHVVEVAMRAARDVAEASSSVGADDQRSIRLVDPVLVLRIEDQVGEIERAPDHVLAAIAGFPRLATVLGAIQRVLGRHRLDEGVDDIRLRRRHGDRYPPPGLRRQSPGAVLVELRPRGAAVRALGQAAAAGRVRPVAPRAERPSLAAEVPHPGEQRLWILGIHRHHGASGGRIGSLQDLAPRLAAVRRLVDAALVRVAPELARDAHVDGVRFGGVDEDLGDALGLLEAEVGPVLAAVRGSVDAVPDGRAVPRPRLTGADPDHLGVLRVDRDRADRLDRLLVEHRLEGGAGVDRLPHAAAGGAGVDREPRPFVHRGERRDAAAHRRRPDVAGAQAGNGRGVHLDRGTLWRRLRARGTREQGGERSGATAIQPWSRHRSIPRRLLETAVVDGNVGLDLLDRDLLSVVAALATALDRVWQVPAGHLLVVAERRLELLLRPADHALLLDLDGD